MTNEILINRFKNKTSSRKRLLFARFETLISSFENASIIAEEINENLGVENLVTVSDIYYCRRHFLKKRDIKKSLKPNEVKKNQYVYSIWEKLTWTDRDTLPRPGPRSKFEKRD